MAKHKRNNFLEKPVWRTIVIIFILLACFLGASLLKLKGFYHFNPLAMNGQFYFSTENAFQLYLAQNLAKTGKIKNFELRLQYPEGFNVSENILLTMEKAAAFGYRMFAPDLPFHRYLFIFVAFFSSLTIIGIFFIIRSLAGDEKSALAATLIYSFSLGAWARTIGSFAREDFTLPLLIFFIFGLTLITYKKKLVVGLILVFTMCFLALASWHLSGFFIVLTLIIFIIFLALTGKYQEIKYIFIGCSLAYLIAALLLPPLRMKLFLLSPGSLLIFICTGSLFLKKWWWRSKTIGLISILAVLICATGLVRILLPVHFSEFGHVYGLILAKIKFFGIKPIDPMQLAADARAFWIGPFDSPSWPVISDYFLLPVLLGIPSAGYLIFVGKKYYLLPLIVLGLAWTVLTLLMTRFMVMAIPFLCVIFGLFVDHIFKSISNKKIHVVLIMLAVLISAGGFLRLGQAPIRDEYMDEEVYRALKYLSLPAEPHAPVLAPFGRSASIVAYTNKSSLLHPMFENVSIREKNQEVMAAFYGSVEGFKNMLKKYDVRYVWYLQSEILFLSGKNSLQYMVGIRDVAKNSPAYLLNFQPEKFPFLKIVHQTSQHRIFLVLRPDEEVADVSFPYSPFFDEENFITLDSIIRNDMLVVKKREIVKSILLALEALQDKNKNEIAGARAKLFEALKIFPRNLMAINNLGSIYHIQGRYEEARKYFQMALEIYPGSIETIFNLGAVSLALDSLSEAIGYFKQAAELSPDFYEAKLRWGECLIKIGRKKDGIKVLQDLLAVKPDYQPAVELLGSLK